MDWTDVLRIFFYLWLFGALGVYAYRGYKRWVRGSADDLAERATVGSSPEKPAAPEPPSAKAPTRRTMRQVLDDQQAAKTPDKPIPEGGLVNSMLKEEVAARKARDAVAGDPTATPRDAGADSTDKSEAPSARGGLFAPLADDAPDAPPRAAPAVSTLLEGMAMPCDLVPLITADVVPSPQHVVFVTTGHAPASVGASIGDELERLGFAMRNESDTEVVATREDDTLRVTLHPDAKRAEKDGAPLFPNVPGGSVAVEFTT